jgi:hypothetical protein
VSLYVAHPAVVSTSEGRVGKRPWLDLRPAAEVGLAVRL